MSPLFSVTKGQPSADELAALATVVAAHASTGTTAGEQTAPARRNAYGRPVDKFNGLPARRSLLGISYS